MGCIGTPSSYPTKCVSSLELAAEDLSRRVLDLESICATLRDDNARLKAKATDLESRSRRQNIRILVLPESTESRRPTEFFSEVYSSRYLGVRHYHLPRKLTGLIAPGKPAPGQRPWPVILHLHQYQTKDNLSREARHRGKLEFRGQPIRIVEDYSPEVISQRAEYKDIMAELYKLGLKPALIYPAPSYAVQWSQKVDQLCQGSSLPRSPRPP